MCLLIGQGLQLVADGVGGAAAGEVASATTAYVVSALAAVQPVGDPVRLLVDAVARAHQQLRRGVTLDPTRAGMATTLTAALARHAQVTLVHIGDSRAYLLRHGRLSRLTSDDTLVQALVDEGRLAPEAVKTHPYRSVVLKSVNADEFPAPAVWGIDAALEEGGRDNVTCLVADVADGPAVCPDGRLLGAMRDPFLVVDPAAVRPGRIA